MSVLIPGARASLEVAGRVFTDLTNLKQLVGFTSGNANSATLRQPGSSSGYQVPVSKSFNMLAISTNHDAAANSNQQFAIAYSDNDNSIASTGSFTNPVWYQFINTGSSLPFSVDGSFFGRREWPLIGWTIPAQKYPGFIDSNASAGLFMQAYGYEV